jgi:hypothetical protein
MQGTKQDIAIWAWTRESDEAILREDILTNEKQHEIKFNIYNQHEVSTTGSKTVSFWTWQEFRLEGYIGKASKTDFGHYSGKFTSTIFFGNAGNNAVTATDEGFVIVWGNQFSNILLEDPGDHNMKMASKVISIIYMNLWCSNYLFRLFV